MKKILFSGTLLASSLLFGQITLDKKFPDDQYISAYSNDTDMFYIGSIRNTNVLYLYNSDFSLRKTINVPVPNGYQINYFSYSTTERDVINITKNIFNTDDKYEFIINVLPESLENNYRPMLLLVNEDGELLKNFNEDGSSSYKEDINLFNDPIKKQNKIIVYKNIQTNNTSRELSEVYSLPSTSLAIKELETIKKNLQAYPNPAQSTLNIVNPKNGTDNVEIYDISGRLILKKDFNPNENKISVDVQDLANGNYIYKIGNSSAKFIKK